MKLSRKTNNTVYNILISYMKKNKYDGLCSNGCGCGIEDLAPCGELENILHCTFAKKYIRNNKKKKCKECFYNQDCEGYCYKPVSRKGIK